MSHFSVLVTGDDVKEALAKYDENLDVPRYLRRTKAQIISDARAEVERYRTSTYAEFLADKESYVKAHGNNPGHIVYLFNKFPEKLTWTDEQLHADAVKYDAENIDADGNEWSECNPDSKWDYWRIGGRWAGALAMKPGKRGHMEPLSWEWGTPGPDAPDLIARADVALIDDVDMEATNATYAIVHGGKWYARAEMGWFGCSHDETVPEQDWPGEWRKVMDSVPMGTLLTVVDCHI